MKINNLSLEELENKYLEKYYHFLMFAKEEILAGLKSKERIKDDWFDIWKGNKDSNTKQGFSVGAERVIYYYISNSRILGEPNSAPVSSDLMFEVDDAIIHIDLKTVQTKNIGDIKKDIFVGNNQNSYNGEVKVNGEVLNYKNANLPEYYTVNTKKKPCLTYFITILHDEETLDTLMINIICMPNGQLKGKYKLGVLKAGKKKDPNLRKKGFVSTVRFKFIEAQDFKLLTDKKRVRVVFLDDKIGKGSEYDKDLKFFIEQTNA